MSAFKKLYIHKPVMFIPFIEPADIKLFLWLSNIHCMKIP